MRLVQFEIGAERAVGIVDGGAVHRINTLATTREIALQAIADGRTMEAVILALGADERHDYDELQGEDRILPPLDHPDPAHCLIAGTGLTHVASAQARSQMNANLGDRDDAELTDSMRVFKWGLAGGKPEGDQPGVQPEWFFKGAGNIVARPGGALPVPDFANDMGEEPELVGLYVIGSDRRPYRLGFAVGNEATDHVMEKKSYLYLPHSKLRFCSFGPELRLGDLPDSIAGRVSIARNGSIVWEAPFATGEANMVHSIANLEYHHFKYDQFLVPGDVHVQFMGTSVASFGAGIRTEIGDAFVIDVPEFGRPLVNGTRRTRSAVRYGGVKAV